ncbi:MAG: patatin-like phospholipase family protein [Oscillospiraceae bacterium]|nr:patatin-like phospholipase family protein [Oscillospiraceae bacterium]
MKRALVFGGGGSRGVYQMGAWTALREMGMDFDIATGTSIGAVNAALYAQRDYGLAKDLWDRITAADIMENVDLELAPSIDAAMNNLSQIGGFIKKYLSERGADVTPFKKILGEIMSEDRILASGIDFGFMTVRFPSFAPREITRADIKPGYLWQYVLASASVFPAFPMCDIDGETYIDGGYYENLPITTALRLGADEVVAVGLHTDFEDSEFDRHPLVRLIYPKSTLGGILSFERELLDRNMRRGYRDTLKAFGRLYGTEYSIRAADPTAFEHRALQTLAALARIEAANDLSANALVKPSVEAPLTAMLRAATFKNAPGVFELYIAALETALEAAGVDSDREWELDDALAELTARAEAGRAGGGQSRDLARALRLEKDAVPEKISFRKLNTEQEKRDIIAAVVLGNLAQ